MSEGIAILVGALVAFAVLASCGALAGLWLVRQEVRRNGALLARGLGAMADSLEAKEMPTGDLRRTQAMVDAGRLPAPSAAGMKARVRRPLTDREELAIEERRRGTDLVDPDRKRENERIVARIRQEEPV